MNLTLRGFPALENLAFRVPEAGVNDAEFAGLLNSISSLRFSTLTLDVGARERRCTQGGVTQSQLFLAEMKALDLPISRLAAWILRRTGRRSTLIVLANNPTAVVGSLTEFQKVGNTWKGEKVIGSSRCDNYWSFAPAKDCEGQIPDDSVLRSINVY